MTAARPPLISLVLATYQRASRLDRLLADVERQTLAPDAFEVVVCVDGSTDATGEVLDRWARRARYPLRACWQPNQGQASARHQAILLAAADRIAMVDDDMQLSPGFLEAHLRAAGAHRERAVVLGAIRPEPGWRRRPLYEVVREHLFEPSPGGAQPVARRLNATAVLGGNLSVPRALYLAVGGFDTSMRLDEDRELGIRLERAGALFIASADAATVHRSDVGSYERWAAREHEYGRAAVRIWVKHGRDPYLHPLRNLVNGSRPKRLVVYALAWSDRGARAGTEVLRRVGESLMRLRMLRWAIASHKAIAAVLYHSGVRDELGSTLRASAREFRSAPGRPRGTTGSGATWLP